MRPESSVHLMIGDCIEQLRDLRSESIDAVVTDPPYELALSGIAWDSTGIAFSVKLWREVLRVLKPGGHLLAFGATRTYHRMASAIEDAGFEIRDSIHWIQGNGFPKSLDVSKAIDRHRDDGEAVLRVTRFIRDARDRAGKSNAEIDGHLRTRGMAAHWTSLGSQPTIPNSVQWPKLKAFLQLGDEMDSEVERLLARKGKPGDAWQQRGVTGEYRKQSPGAMWKSQRETGSAPIVPGKERRDEAVTKAARDWQGWGTTLKPAHEPIVLARKPFAGRVADNVLCFKTGALNIDACRGTERDDDRGSHSQRRRRWPTNVILDEEAAREVDAQRGENVSRFFYVPKPDRAERDAGLDESFVEQRVRKYGPPEDSGTTYETRRRRNVHPTVKPVALMRYLVRLVTPPGGIVLDPFVGSGTTGIAAVLEGASFVGIDRNAEYVAIANARINHWKGKGEERDVRLAA